MKKPQVLQLLNCNQTELADLLGYTPSAVAQWGDEKPIPEKSYLRLRYEIAPHLPWPKTNHDASITQPPCHALESL